MVWGWAREGCRGEGGLFELDPKARLGQEGGEPQVHGQRWRKEERALVAESGSKVEAGAGEVGMMLQPLRPLEFMVRG